MNPETYYRNLDSMLEEDLIRHLHSSKISFSYRYERLYQNSVITAQLPGIGERNFYFAHDWD